MRNPSVAARRPSNVPAGMISGRKTTTTSARNASRSPAQRAGVTVLAELEEARLQPGPLAERAGLEEGRWPTKASRTVRQYDSTRSMADWQERITRETNPALRVEHDLRYRLAEPLILGGRTWVDLGCGNGVAAGEALGGAFGGLAVLVDVDAQAVEAAEHEIAAGATVALQADLADRDALVRVRDAILAGDAPRTSPLRGHRAPEDVRPAARAAVGAGRAGRGDGAAQRPQRRLLGARNPFHETMWGRGRSPSCARSCPRARWRPASSRCRARRSSPRARTTSASRCRSSRAPRGRCRRTSLPRSARRPACSPPTPASRRPTSTRAAGGSASARPTSPTWRCSTAASRAAGRERPVPRRAAGQPQGVRRLADLHPRARGEAGAPPVGRRDHVKVCFLVNDLQLSGGVGVVVQHARRWRTTTASTPRWSSCASRSCRLALRGAGRRPRPVAGGGARRALRRRRRHVVGDDVQPLRRPRRAPRVLRPVARGPLLQARPGRARRGGADARPAGGVHHRGPMDPATRSQRAAPRRAGAPRPQRDRQVGLRGARAGGAAAGGSAARARRGPSRGVVQGGAGRGRQRRARCASRTT